MNAGGHSTGIGSFLLGLISYGAYLYFNARITDDVRPHEDTSPQDVGDWRWGGSMYGRGGWAWTPCFSGHRGHLSDGDAAQRQRKLPRPFLERKKFPLDVYGGPLPHLNEPRAEKFKTQILSLPRDKTYVIVSVIGDDAGLQFATELLKFMNDNKFTVYGVDQALFSGLVTGIYMYKEAEGRFNIVIGRTKQ